MILDDVLQITVRPSEMFRVLAGTPAFAGAAVLVAAAQGSIALFLLWMRMPDLSSGVAVGGLLFIVIVLVAKLSAAACFLFLVMIVSGRREDQLLKRCASVVVNSSFILLLRNVMAVAIGVLIRVWRGGTLASVTFLNLNDLMSAFHLPFIAMLEKADIFAAWYAGVLAVGITTLFNFRYPTACILAAADWALVAAIEETLLQLTRIPLGH